MSAVTTSLNVRESAVLSSRIVAILAEMRSERKFETRWGTMRDLEGILSLVIDRVSQCSKPTFGSRLPGFRAALAAQLRYLYNSEIYMS